MSSLDSPQTPYRSRARRKVDYWRIMAAMILGSALFTIWSAPFWQVQKVEIRGTTAFTEKHLAGFLKSHKLVGQHILKLNPILLERELLKNPLVLTAHFERELLPTRLTVRVQERKPAHVVYRQQSTGPLLDKSKAWILDHEGVVLPLPASAAPEGPVQVSVKPPIIKQRLPQAQLDLMRLLEVLSDQKLLTVDGIYDISQPQNLIFYLKQPRLTVWLGKSEDLVIKLKLIQPTLETAKQDIASIDYIDLRFWKHPVIKSK